MRSSASFSKTSCVVRQIDRLPGSRLRVAAVTTKSKESRSLRLQQHLVKRRRTVALVGRFRADQNLLTLRIDFEGAELLQQVGHPGA